MKRLFMVLLFSILGLATAQADEVRFLPDRDLGRAPNGQTTDRYLNQVPKNGGELLIHVWHDKTGAPSRCDLVAIDFDSGKVQQNRRTNVIDAPFSLAGMTVATSDGGPVSGLQQNGRLGRMVMLIPKDGVIRIYFSPRRVAALRRLNSQRGRDKPTFDFEFGTVAGGLSRTNHFLNIQRGLGSVLTYGVEEVWAYTQNHC